MSCFFCMAVYGAEYDVHVSSTRVSANQPLDYWRSIILNAISNSRQEVEFPAIGVETEIITFN